MIEYLYSMYGDGNDVYIYRTDRDGNVAYAKIGDEVYVYIHVSEVPDSVISEFVASTYRCWVDNTSVITPKPLPKRNDEDTGITTEQFIDSVLNSYLNIAVYEDGVFYVNANSSDGTTKKVVFPPALLKRIALIS